MPEEFLSKENTGSKICESCGEEKSLKSFSAGKKNGKMYYKRNCGRCNQRLTKLRKFHRESFLKPSPYFFCEESWRDFRVCSACKTSKPIVEFDGKSGKTASRCKGCEKTARVGKQRKKCNVVCEVCLNQFIASTGKAKFCSRICLGISLATKTITVSDGQLFRTCAFCKKNKSADSYHKTKTGLPVSRCKDCKNELAKQDYRSGGRVYKYQQVYKKSLKARESSRKYYRNLTPERKKIALTKNRENCREASRRRRARLANCQSVFFFTKTDIIKRDGLHCYLCNKSLTEKSATLEHILPISRGGNHKPENIKLACKFCNSSKHNKTLTEYKKYRGDYDRFTVKI